MTVELEALGALACSYLERQPWYQETVSAARAAFGAARSGGASGPAAGARGGDGSAIEVELGEVIRPGRPGLARFVLALGELRFQLLVGWRPAASAAEALRGGESALLGPCTDDDGPVLAYDALADDDLVLALLTYVTGGAERAERVRRMPTLASHHSLVFDERLFMKCYRVLERGPRPEVDMVLKLDEAGFNALPAPVAHWRAGGYDLALVREFLPGALEGRLLAMTSLRDLLAHAQVAGSAAGEPEAPAPGSAAAEAEAEADTEVAAAGGDLASEMRRLGATTASLHLALAQCFGEEPAGRSSFARALRREGVDPEATLEKAGRLEEGTAGSLVRLHGDYHLRRVMRSEAGWLVVGFGDDPLYGASDAGSSMGHRRGSPLEDLADMSFSLRSAAREALGQRSPAEMATASRLAQAWWRRNSGALVEGYLAVEGAARLLPSDPGARETLLAAFESARELRYEATPAEA